MTPHPLSLHDLAPGKRLVDRYTVVQPHRQGGFSTAFEVTDEEDESRCELQLFPGGLFDSDEQMADFRDKLLPLTEIDCEGVLRVRAVLDLDGSNVALITDYPEGEPLRARLKDGGRLTQEEVVTIGCQLLDGLTRIHALDLVHGDIKPYTIDVRGKGLDMQAMLVDGGITPGLWTAKDLGDKTALIGTPYYAPVEQFGGDAPDVRSDIYNLATVLYEALAGVLPWKAKTFLEVFQAKLQDPPSIATRAPEVEVDPRVDEVIRRGCLADRRKRFATAVEFCDALRELA